MIQLENLTWSKKRVKPCITVDDSEITQKVIVEYYFWCCMVITPGIRNSYFMQALIIVSSMFHPVFRYSCFTLLHSKILLLAAAATTKTCISLLSNCLCVKQNILQELFNHFFFYKQRSFAVHPRKLLHRKIPWESMQVLYQIPAEAFISWVPQASSVQPQEQAAAGTTWTDPSSTDKLTQSHRRGSNSSSHLTPLS